MEGDSWTGLLDLRGEEEWGRINKVAVAKMRVRKELLELMDVFEAEHGYASPELKTAFDLSTFLLEMFEKVLCNNIEGGK